MTARIILFRRPGTGSSPAIETLKTTVLDSRICSDHRTALMLVAEAVGRPINLIHDLETLAPAEAEAALRLVRQYYCDRSARLEQMIVERRQRA